LFMNCYARRSLAIYSRCLSYSCLSRSLICSSYA
jgi:hypothetical protein